MAEGPPQDRPPEFGARPKMRPPNQKKFEKELEALNEKIRIKEAELKSLGKPSKESSPGVTAERSQLNMKLRNLRAEKNETIKKRKEKEQELLAVRSEITKKGDILSKLEASLPYRTMEGLERALKNLDYQLQHKRLTSREESRLVREIENLKRSLSKVREYDQKKTEIEEDKDRRTKLKEEKDKYFNHVSDLKKQEEAVKVRLSAFKQKEDEAWARYREGGDRRDQLKAVINQLYEERREAQQNHKVEQQNYKQYLKEYREGERKRIQDTRREKVAERIRLQKEYDESREPYIEERQTCAALIKYLQNYLPQDEEGNLNSAAKVRHSTESLYPHQRDLADSEFTVLRRKGDSDDDGVGQPYARRKKGRRQRRHSGHSKHLRHSHQIFLQFLSLKVDAPPTMAEVVEALVTLRSKLDYLEKMAKEEKMPSDLSSSHGSDFTMSDYSAGTNELMQDHALLDDEKVILEDREEEEEGKRGEEDSRFLPSDTSKDDGIHSLSSSSTVNDFEPNVDLPCISNYEMKLDLTTNHGKVGDLLKQDGDLKQNEDLLKQDEGLADIKESQTEENKRNDDQSRVTNGNNLVEKNKLNSKKNNLIEDVDIIPEDGERGEYLSSEIPSMTKSIEDCNLGVKVAEVTTSIVVNGVECNSNNSNTRSTPSKTQTVEYVRTLSDTINQNDVVVKHS